MTHTQSRTLQYIGLILIAGLMAVSYWYFSVRAGVTTNSSVSQPGGTGRLDSGLAGYWKLDDGTSGATPTTAADASTNSITSLTLTNGPTWTTGQINNAIDFDGTDDYATTADTATLDFVDGESFTVGAWFNRDTATTIDVILGKKNSTSATDPGYLLYIDSTTDQLIFEVADGVDEYYLFSTSSFTATGWNHVAAVWNQESGTAEIYINGVAQGTSATGTISSIGDLSNALAFQIGQYVGGSPFDGKLDEIRIYDRALSSDEVAKLYGLTTPTTVDTGLEGYWSFNAQDMNGTAAYDRSGAGNTGTLTNSPTVTKGRLGQGIDFDGTDDYVSIGDATTLDFNNTDFTLYGWFRRESFSTNDTIVAKRNGITAGDTGYLCYLDATTDKLICEVSDGVDEYSLTSSATFTSADWNQFTLVWDDDAASGIDLYINGVAINAAKTGTLGNIGDLSNAVTLRFGAESDAGEPFDGTLDEVRVYSRSLTAAEVKGLYDTGSTDKLGTSAGQPQGTGRLDSGLVGYWKYDDGSGSTAADASTNADTGTLTNGPTWTTGQIGGAVNFDGNNDYVTSAGATAADIRDSISLAQWVKFDAFPTSGNRATFINNDTGGNHLYTFELYNNSGTYFITFIPGGGGNENTSAGVSISTGTWYHMAVSYDAQSNDVIFYLNGAVVGTADDSVVGGYAGGTGTLYFGSDASTGSYLDGQMDEVRIYDRVLSSDEMAALSRLTTPTAVDTGLEGYWSFNAPDMTSTTAYDRSGAGSTGTLQDNAAGSRGQVGQAIALDGSFDRIDVGDMPSLEGQSAITISSWVRPSSLVDFAGILCKYSSTTSDTCLQAGGSGVGSNTAINATIRNGSDAYGYTASGKLSVGAWTHVAMVFDGSLSGNANRLKVYVDGVQETLTFSGTIPTTTVSNTQNFIIGRTGGASNYWNGKLDEVRAYNRALTAAEIRAQYDAGAPDKVNSSVSQPQGSGRLDSGLLGYWKLDETTGSSAADSSTAGNNGTLNNMENGDWTTGRIGNGLTFDGSNEYITMGDINSMDGLSQLTVSAWAKSSSLAVQRTIVSKAGCNGLTDSGPFEMSAGYAADARPEMLVYPSGGTPTDYYQVFGANDIDDGQWHHLVGTYDGAFLRMYMDGALSGTTAAPGGDLASVGTQLNIGRCPGVADHYWNDMIDEVRIYNRALGADEVRQLYQLTAPTGVDTSLKAYWSFNGQDMNGTTANDRSGAGNNGTLTNGPAAIRGKVGQALSFDGTDDYVTESAINLSGTNKASVALWLYQSSFGTGDNLAFEVTADTNGNTTGFYLNPNSSGSCNGYISLALRGNTGVNSACYVRPSAGAWHHYVAILDKSQSTNEVDLYIDGVLQTATSRPATNNNNNTTDMFGNDPWYIMSRAGTSLINVGRVDEFRVYNRVLTAAEVQSLYQAGK